MAKSKRPYAQSIKEITNPEDRWDFTHGTYISGRAFIDGADAAAIEMERRWGVDRLRLLVDPQLREKFDRQRYLFNQAIQNGDLEAVRRESARMIAAWRALDAAAQTAGKQSLSPEIWEVALSDGSVAAIVPDAVHAAQVIAEGRKLAVYTLDEIARLLGEYRAIVATKLSFPGATVTAVRSISDPLDAFHDAKISLDDPIPDFAATAG